MADPAWFPNAKLRRGERCWLKEQAKTFVQVNTSFCNTHIHVFRTSTILNYWKMKLVFLVGGREQRNLLCCPGKTKHA